MPVGLHDAADIGLHRRALQRPARLGLDDRSERLVLDFLVALERHVVEHRRLTEMHDQPIAGAFDGHVVEQARPHQRLQRCIARGFIVPAVGGCMKIGAHRLGVDPPIAVDFDGVGRQRLRRKEPERGDQQRARRDPPRRRPRDNLSTVILPLSPIWRGRWKCRRRARRMTGIRSVAGLNVNVLPQFRRSDEPRIPEIVV